MHFSRDLRLGAQHRPAPGSHARETCHGENDGWASEPAHPRGEVIRLA